MSIESLVIGKNPYTEEMVIGLDPGNFGTDALERLFWTLVASQERKQVIAFGKKEGPTTYFNNDWFKATKRLPTRDQEERIKTGIVNIISSHRVIVSKTPPIT